MLLLWVMSVSWSLGTESAAATVSRLRIINGCEKEPLWVAHMAAIGIGPDPQNIKLAPLQSHDFNTPGGLTGTRYWPKMRCNADGNACGIGESGGPQEVCDDKAHGCAPPVDTKFEATFGDGQEGDWVDISLVDGFTLPFKFEMKGDCQAGFGKRSGSGHVVDCSQLSFDNCPTAEDLGIVGSNVNLKVIHPITKEVVGCYSPCSKLTLGQWDNTQAMAPNNPQVVPYCCPTPPESPHQCRQGPVKNTKFVRAVHQMCPGVYGYSYDDGMGLLRCPSDTHYEVTFYCPGNHHTNQTRVPSANKGPILPPRSKASDAKYVASDDVKECPEGTLPLSEDECRAMPDYFGGELHEPLVIESAADPKGCFRYKKWYYYNTHPAGSVGMWRTVYCKKVNVIAEVTTETTTGTTTTSSPSILSIPAGHRPTNEGVLTVKVKASDVPGLLEGAAVDVRDGGKLVHAKVIGIGKTGKTKHRHPINVTKVQKPVASTHVIQTTPSPPDDDSGPSTSPWMIVLFVQSGVVCAIAAYTYRLHSRAERETRPPASFLVPNKSPSPMRSSPLRSSSLVPNTPNRDTWRGRGDPPWSPKEI